MRCTNHTLSRSMLCGIFLVVLTCHVAHAESVKNDSWHFQLAPYAWLAGQKGTVATLPGLPSTDIDIDFWDDIADNINGALLIVGEARKDKFGLFMDIIYSDIEDDAATPGPLFSAIVSRTKSTIVTAAGFYRLVDNPGAFLDVGAGARYWSVDSTLKLRAGLLPAIKASNKEDWIDPIVGVKGLSSLGDSKFFVSGGLSIGGFGAGSDFMWDANVNLGYQWTDAISTLIGYRYLDVDYEKDEFLYDVAQHGPVLGLSWRF